MKYTNRNIILAGLGFILVVTFFTFMKFHRYNQGLSVVISSDAEGYHQYLTALFINGGILDQPYSYPLDNGKLFNKYNYGVALLQLPFFLVAHAFTSLFDLHAQVKITPYVFSVIGAGAFYVFVGLLLIYRILRKSFSNKTTWLTVSSLFLATNLLYYTYREPGVSHAYVFFLVATFITGVDLFYRRPNLKSVFLIAIPVAIILLLRITHVVLLLYLVLYGVSKWNDLKRNGTFLLKHWRLLAIIPLCIVVFYIPQILYWHATTGEYFVNPYHYSLVEEGFFNWNKPKIGLVLFGPVGGWLLITPLMIFTLYGIYQQFKSKVHTPIGTAVILILVTYVYASWWHPTLAGSYGHRGFVDLYPMLAIPLAFSFEKISENLKISWKLLVSVVILLMFINTHLSYLYNYWWWDIEWTYIDFLKMMVRVFFIPVEIQTFP